MLSGSIPALITPFAQGEVDLKAFADFVEWQVASGSHGVVPCGTTGETPTLEDAEIREILGCCVDVVRGRVPIIAGTGSNSTKKTIAMTGLARACGCDAALIVTPYYNKPTQEGLYAHYRAVHDATDLPIILYNVPSRTGVDLSVDTVLRLAELPRIAGIKEASGDVTRVIPIRSGAGRDFAILCGDDALAGAFLAQGADGCISVTANVAPRECADVQNAWRARDVERFQSLQGRLMPLHKVLFTETSPAPVKYAVSRLGLCRDEVRLPLVPATSACRVAVDSVMEKCGLNSSLEPATLRAVHG